MTYDLDLDAILCEPIVRLMMERDGIKDGEVRQILQKVKSARSLQERTRGQSADEITASTMGSPAFGDAEMLQRAMASGR
jgi:hypothetical protein